MPRLLPAFLALALVAAPVSAALCGDCSLGHCMTASPQESSETAAANHPAADRHCEQAETPEHTVEVEKIAPAGQGEAPLLNASDCCAIMAAAEPQQTATMTGALAPAVALQPAPATAPATAPRLERDRGSGRESVPGVRPLYTLHAAFLI